MLALHVLRAPYLPNDMWRRVPTCSGSLASHPSQNKTDGGVTEGGKDGLVEPGRAPLYALHQIAPSVVEDDIGGRGGTS